MRSASSQTALILSLLATFPYAAKATAAADAGPAGGPPASPSCASAPLVAIQPLGVLDPGLAHAVAERVKATFAVDVVVLPTKPLPGLAFYRPRMRFRGARLIDWLEATKPQRVSTVLGLMSRDLSATKGHVRDWGVMGVAGLSRTAGVVSTHRMVRGHASAGLVRRRACQVAVHELGHTFGLPHCPSPNCIMNDAQGGIASVDRSSGMFCRSCGERLGGLLRSSRAMKQGAAHGAGTRSQRG